MDASSRIIFLVFQFMVSGTCSQLQNVDADMEKGHHQFFRRLSDLLSSQFALYSQSEYYFLDWLRAVISPAHCRRCIRTLCRCWIHEADDSHGRVMYLPGIDVDEFEHGILSDFPGAGNSDGSWRRFGIHPGSHDGEPLVFEEKSPGYGRCCHGQLNWYVYSIHLKHDADNSRRCHIPHNDAPSHNPNRLSMGCSSLCLYCPRNHVLCRCRNALPHPSPAFQ